MFLFHRTQKIKTLLSYRESYLSLITLETMRFFNTKHRGNTVWKVSKYGVFSGPYFPAFGMNTEKYGVSLCIQSKCRKIRTRKTPNTDIFQAVELVWPKEQHHLKSWVKLKALIQRNFWVLFKTYVFKSIFKIKSNSNHFL